MIRDDYIACLRLCIDHKIICLEYHRRNGRAGIDKINKKVESAKALQAELDHRTEVENQAIQLICECRFQEADDLFHSLDDSIVKDEWDAIIQGRG